MNKPTSSLSDSKFDLSRIERQAFFLASSLDALFHAMPEDKIDDRVSARFLVGNLAIVAQQLGIAAQNEDTSRLLPHSLGEVE